MPSNRPKHDREFKINAVRYVDEHPDLTLEQCAKNLGIETSIIARWKNQYQKNGNNIPVRASKNHASDEQKEIARLKRQLRDAQDAIDVLKKAISNLDKD